MANTYTSLHYHFTFSTKNREPWIAQSIQNRIWAYIGGVARAHKITAIQIGGIDDHIHALVMAPPTLSPSHIAQYLKGDSSKWIHEKFSELRLFEWQDGYGGFTVSRSQIPNVVKYIKNQQTITARRRFRKSTLSCCGDTASITMSVTCGVDSVVASRRVQSIGVRAGLKSPA